MNYPEANSEKNELGRRERERDGGNGVRKEKAVKKQRGKQVKKGPGNKKKERGLAKRAALPRAKEQSCCTLLSGSRFTGAKASDYYRPC